jgi:hypothetical protein
MMEAEGEFNRRYLFSFCPQESCGKPHPELGFGCGAISFTKLCFAFETATALAAYFLLMTFSIHVR